jgi:DinB superfamily
MAADRGYIQENDKERARLEAFVARCTDADLERPVPGGWTVAGILAHVAFWDERIRLLFERWQREGVAPADENEADVDWINDSAKPMFLALAPRRAAELAVSIARAVDQAVARLPEDTLTRNAAARTPLNVVRAMHRNQHLDELERVLGHK